MCLLRAGIYIFILKLVMLKSKNIRAVTRIFSYNFVHNLSVNSKCKTSHKLTLRYVDTVTIAGQAKCMETGVSSILMGVSSFTSHCQLMFTISALVLVETQSPVCPLADGHLIHETAVDHRASISELLRRLTTFARCN